MVRHRALRPGGDIIALGLGHKVAAGFGNTLRKTITGGV